MQDTPGTSIPSEFAGDEEMVEIIEAFVSEMPARVEALCEAWARRELQRLERMAHQLKGAGAGYGYPVVTEAAESLERSLDGANGGDDEPEAVRARFERLVDVCRRIVVR